MSLDGTPDDYVDRIAVGLSRSEPIEKMPGNTASVAIVFRRAGSFLLIKRVERSDDPWSGQVAFPGGRVQAGDASFLETACREAREEVGLDLRTKARFLGYMKNFEPWNRRVSVIPCIFHLTEEEEVVGNDEVSSYLWVSLSSLAVGRSQYILYREEKRLALPAFRFGDYVVWGLTERILTELGELAGVSVDLS